MTRPVSPSRPRLESCSPQFNDVYILESNGDSEPVLLLLIPDLKTFLAGQDGDAAEVGVRPD